MSEKDVRVKPKYTGLKCKTPDCDNTVNSHKGLAGWCAVLQPNGKTHRQEQIDRNRVEHNVEHIPEVTNGVVAYEIGVAYANLAAAYEALGDAQKDVIKYKHALMELLDGELVEALEV